jgi:hypothetical protein
MEGMSSPFGDRGVSPATPAPYIEKLRAPWWLWLVSYALCVAVGLALSPTNAVLLSVIAIAAAIIVTVLLVVSAPSIIITQDTLQVGRARIERRFLGEATGYAGEAARYQRGRGLNGLAFMSFRGWVDPVVTVSIEDPNDSTPYWIFSTRRPERVAAALGGSMSTQAAPSL